MVYEKIYVKDEGSNFNGMTIALKLVVSYEFLRLESSFQGTCFGHVFSKACRYGTIKKNIHAKIKFVQAYLQKCIAWPKKFRKGRYEWNKAYVKIGI
jgi:hypothetical protein